MKMNFDIIFVNNASKKVKILQKQENVSEDKDYLSFENVELDLPDGEYTYAAIYNSRDDVRYNVKNDLLETIVMTDEGNVPLKVLRPLMGLLMVKNEEKKTLFYNPTRDNGVYTQNLTIFYYNE
jgi:hypothetical protein